MSTTTAQSLADINARIGRSYDELPYDMPLAPRVTPDHVFPIAALYGYEPPPSTQIDVLDLGCGTGSQLDLIAGLAGGRIVGADVSAEASQRARERCAHHGDRVTIHTTDLLALQPEDLGTFEFVVCLGVIYVVPPAVRSHILRLMSACLKPGGVGVLSYYAGTTPLLRAQLFQLLRDGTDPAATVAVRVKEARKLLLSFRERVPESARYRASLDDVIKYTDRQEDSVFFHEVLSHTFESLPTVAVAAELAADGVEFLDYLKPVEAGHFPTSAERARAATLMDFASGGYHYAMIGRPKGAAVPPTVRSPAVQWTTALRRMSPGNTLGGELLYSGPNNKGTVRSSNIPFQALVERLITRPQGWSELLEGVRDDARAHNATPVADTTVAADLTYLWQRRHVTPRLLP